MATPPIYASRKSIGGVALSAWKNPQRRNEKNRDKTKAQRRIRGMGKRSGGWWGNRQAGKLAGEWKDKEEKKKNWVEEESRI